MFASKALRRNRDSSKAQSVEECRDTKSKTVEPSKTIRILFANVAGIPLEPLSKKDDDIQKWISKSNADVIGLAETNICWQKARGGPFKERMNKWVRTSEPHLTTNQHSSIANNELEEFPGEYQIGGVALMTRGGLSCKIMDKGRDGTRLGRWAWTDFRGVKGLKLRIICAYRNVQTSNRGGTETVHAQHMRGLDKLERVEEPIKAFDTDFLGSSKRRKRKATN